jgi:predicted adenine nucleotide alpha hydrolase (AANH) superfamily ATPase
MKINYQKKMETIINGFEEEIKPKLLLHSCCAPCSSYVLNYLNTYFDITVFFYNPNMIDLEEFEKRFEEQKKIIKALNIEVNLIKVDYDDQDFYKSISGFESEPEGGLRCEKCFRLRLEEAAKYASSHHYDYFTTTLSISPLKNSKLLNEIGSELEGNYSVQYLFSDFKKKEGYKKSVDLSKEYDLYRQDYCGCIFSKNS